jgi:hypothetical protein
VIQKRTATREIFQVNFRTTAGRPLVVIGNHWPARLPGQYDTEPFRIVAAETLAYFVERILEVLGPATTRSSRWATSMTTLSIALWSTCSAHRIGRR